MNFYNEKILPQLINCACGMQAIDRMRAQVVPLAQGDVLEIGMGSGLNLKHYNASTVNQIWGLEPSHGMRRMAQENVANCTIPITWLDLPSESIPLEDNSVDSIVLTYTLCTIVNWQSALLEMKRVLKNNGVLLFSEHGEADDESVRKWQKRVNPLWKKLAGGCNLNRAIPRLIESVGFNIVSLDEGYIKGPKIATYQYTGSAKIS